MRGRSPAARTTLPPALEGESRAPARPAQVAVIGNPNTGKSTVFNALTGLRQKVGNYPGVTVEKLTGTCRSGRVVMELHDLPGTYSLAARSPDEAVAVDVMLGRTPDMDRPDAVLVVVDAANLERNLYLVSQIMELGLPIVVALNMLDQATERGISVDQVELSRRLGVPVVGTVGRTGQGIERLRRVVAVAALGGGKQLPEPPRLPSPLAGEIDSLHAWLAERDLNLHHVEVERAIVDVRGEAERRLVGNEQPGLRDRLEEARRAARNGRSLASVEARARYDWIHAQLAGLGARPQSGTSKLTDRIDRVLTHRVFGLVIFIGLMAFVFQSVFTWATPIVDQIDGAFASLGETLGTALPEGALNSLIVDGLIAGVGGVLVFLPQILILFLLIGILEDCGYLARAAFLMDRIMVKAGLSGKSFIPMMSSFACAVPGVMATRTIENRRDRLVTMMTAPLLTCSARLPVYALLIAAFVPAERFAGGMVGLQGLMLLGLYLVGILGSVAVALVVRRTVLRGGAAPFLMELPTYKLPSLKASLRRLFDRGRTFVVRVGTIILAATAIIWALSYLPHPASVGERFETERQALPASMSADAREQKLSEIDNAEAAAYLDASALGQIGQAIQPAFKPLGWNWEVTAAVLAAFPAREVVISALGTTYSVGSDADEESEDLQQKLQSATFADGAKVFNLPMVVGLLLFMALCLQCAATVGTIRRESGGWRWPAFTWAYMSVLAYLSALVVFQVGSLI